LFRRCIAEACGAGLIVLGDVGSTALATHGWLPDFVALAIIPGVMVMILIYLFSDLSGAHFNPAVTVAFALRRSFPWRIVPAYVCAQVVGAVSAAVLLYALNALVPGRERVHTKVAFALEGAGTMLLVMMILATAKRKAILGPETGLVVGFTVLLIHTLLGPLTAITLNPARALGPALVLGHSKDWPHVLGPLLGAFGAVGLTWFLRGRSSEEEEKAAQGDHLVNHETSSTS